MDKKPSAPLHIFRAGTHVATDGKRYSFSEADIADMIGSYDPQLARAPLVVGHPKTDDPAYGWVDGLQGTDGNMFALPAAVEPQFAQMVNEQRFANISASVFLPDTPGNPKPGHFYLRHVGFLGAAAPAVKGLQRPQFADGSDGVEFSMPLQRRITSVGYYLKRLFQGLRDRAIESDGAEKAEQLIPQWCIDGIAEATADDDTLGAAFAEAARTPETTMTEKNPADFAAAEAALNKKTTDLDERERALKKREDDARREDAAEFADALVNDGKILPRQKAGVVELLLAIPAGTTLNFAEADGQDPKDAGAEDVLRTFLSDLGKRVDFAEKSGGQDNGTTVTADFAAPAGAQVDAGRLELHGKAIAYQQAHPGIDYMTAVKAVGG